jgi:hypothetical protein
MYLQTEERDYMGNYKLTLVNNCFLYTICGMLSVLFLLATYVFFVIIFEIFVGLFLLIKEILFY